MDAVLIAVVALCTVDNDVIHAAYLALALLLFRRRDALRAEGNTLFKWLPVYNFAVMLVTLAYQAPLARLFGANWNFEDKVNMRATQLAANVCFGTAALPELPRTPL